MLFRIYVKRLLPRSLFGRSLLIIVLPLIILQVVSTYVFFDRYWQTVSRRLAEALAGDVAAIVETLRRMPGEEERARTFRAARYHMEIVADLRPGEILPNAAPTEPDGMVETLLFRALNERVQRPFLIDMESLPRDVEIHVQLPDGVLVARTTRKRLVSSTTYIFVLWMVGTSLILFAVASIFMRNQVRPIRRLARAAAEFGKGRDEIDFRPEGAAEVRRAAQAFNIMRQRIRRHLSQRTDMLAGVSHDLRTPLTRMKLGIALLGDGRETQELKADVAEMERMLEGYLDFVRGEGEEAPEPTDLGLLLEDTVAAARREGARIDFHCPEEITLPVRPNALRRCFANLIGNAARYGDLIAVRVGRSGDAVEVVIDDNGPGIPPDKREDVFRPFFRLDESRNPATGGTGLGLAIARDMVRGHGGDILLEDAPTGGLRARVRLPV